MNSYENRLEIVYFFGYNKIQNRLVEKKRVSFMEIERRFLINNIEDIDLDKYEKKHIIQDYLYKDKFTAIRKRMIKKENVVKYVYTVKTKAKGIAINEIEHEISKEEYESIHTNPKFNTIDKIRYVIPYVEGLKIELDVFNGCYNGIIFAEIEFKNEEQAQHTKLPKWFGSELSCKLTNSDMAVSQVDEILKKIDNIK